MRCGACQEEDRCLFAVRSEGLRGAAAVQDRSGPYPPSGRESNAKPGASEVEIAALPQSRSNAGREGR